jgi:excisionase family DNA binding protein
MNKLERLLLRPTEAGEVLGISRSRVYELLASGEIPSVEVGNPRTGESRWRRSGSGSRKSGRPGSSR